MRASEGYLYHAFFLAFAGILAGCDGGRSSGDAGSGSSKQIFKDLFQSIDPTSSSTKILSDNQIYVNTRPSYCRIEVLPITETRQGCGIINPPIGLAKTTNIFNLSILGQSADCDITLESKSPLLLPVGSSWQLSMWRAHSLPDDVSLGIEYEFNDSTKYNALAKSNFKSGPLDGNDITTDIIKNTSGASKQLKFIHFTARGSVSVSTFGICLTNLTLSESTK